MGSVESPPAQDPSTTGCATRGFVCILPQDDWETYVRRHHIGALTEYGKLLVVERPLGMKRSLSPGGRPLRKAVGAGPNGPYLVQPGCFVPRIGSSWDRVRARRIGARIRRELDVLGVERPTAVLTSPSQGWFFDTGLECDAVCFELSDEFSLYLQYPPDRSRDKHEKLVGVVERSDLVFCTARSLAEKYGVHRGNTHWVPNTAEPTDFSIGPDTEVLPELAGLDGPVIGFIGGLNPWIDLELVRAVRELRPEWTIVFSASLDGPPAFLESDELRSLGLREDGKGGIRLPGWVPYPKLRNFLAGVDVCALFHKADRLGRYIHPNKIYQYLACGKPIVSTAFLPEVEMFGELVRVAETAEEFVAAIETALNERDPELVRARREFAAASAPAARAAHKMELIERFLSSSDCDEEPAREAERTAAAERR